MNHKQILQRHLRSVITILAAALLVLVFHSRGAASEPAERVIQFPATESLGTLYVRESNTPPPETMMIRLISERSSLTSRERPIWRKVGKAQSAVAVPEHKDVLLEITDPSIDLAGLLLLKPDDLQALIFEFPAPGDLSPFVRHLTSLKVLDLSSSRLDDEGLEALKGLHLLELLDVGGTAITDAGLVHLRNFPVLKVLDIGETKITDAGLAHIKKLHSLEILGLSNTRITDAGLAEISGLTSLRVLLLNDTAITSAGLAHLENMDRLENLQIAGTNVGNAAVPHLKQLRSLAVVLLTHTRMTDAAAAELYDDIPDVLLDWMEPLFASIFRCFLMIPPVLFLLLPLLNKKMFSGASRGILLFLSCLAGLLIWFVPVIFTEITSSRAGNPFGWYRAYSQALVLGIIFGIAMYLQVYLANTAYYQKQRPIPVYVIFVPLAVCSLFWILFRPPFPVFLLFPVPSIAPASLAFLVLPVPPVALVVGGVNFYHMTRLQQR